MYVSIRDDILHATGFSDFIEGLKFFSIQGIELAVDREYKVRRLSPQDSSTHYLINRPEEVAELKKEAAANGVRISALLLGNNFNAPDKEKELDWIVRSIEVAAELGAPAVRIDAIMSGEADLPLEEREQIFASGVKYVLDKTSRIQVDLGIENHGRQGNDPAFLDGLMALVQSPRLGMTMDTGNFYWAGHPLDRVYEILEHLAPKTFHTHIKNIRYPEEMRQTQRPLGYKYGEYVCPIPDGDIDHQRVINMLKMAGYDRDICLEDESLGRYDQDQRRKNIQRAVDYFKAMIG